MITKQQETDKCNARFLLSKIILRMYINREIKKARKRGDKNIKISIQTNKTENINIVKTKSRTLDFLINVYSLEVIHYIFINIMEELKEKGIIASVLSGDGMYSSFVELYLSWE